MSEELGSVYELQTNIADAQPPMPLPTGEYRASVRNSELRTSKASGNPMLALTYHIAPDQYPADYTDGDPNGETLMTFAMLLETPKHRYLLKKFMEMHGVAPSNRVVATDFIGQEVIVRVTHDEHQGMPQARANPVRAA